MNTKRKGTKAERRAKKILEKAGYMVIRSAGSLGCFDSVALGSWGSVRLIQVKKDKPITEEERENLNIMAKEYKKFSVEYWFFPKGAREPIITVF